MLKIGDKAPDFNGIDQNEREVKLSDYQGKKLVIYFYPKDMTPGCTQQACNLRDNYQLLLDAGISIVGVSADTIEKHQRFQGKYNLPFPLLADTNKIILNAYGVWGPKKFMGRAYEGIHRTTFLINEEGNIHGIITKPKVKAHAEEIMEIFNKE